MAGPRFLVIGAGSRGDTYARAVTLATPGSIVAVAEPDAFRRREFGKKYIWKHSELPRPGQEFVSWQDWIGWEAARRASSTNKTINGDSDSDSHATHQQHITGVFICTLDDTHAEIIGALAPLNLHILCEKPLALSMADCLSISHAFQQSGHSSAPEAGLQEPKVSTNGTYQDPNHPNNPQIPLKIFSIGHVLRYSPHNILLRKLLLHDHAIGDVVSIEHTEPVGWWHFSHSYVRGNWRRSTPQGVGSLLTKSCHDIDFLLWLLCSPPDPTSNSSTSKPARPHLPSTISSTGALTHFRKARKPVKAGLATNCLSCAAEPDCNFSAQKIYRDRWLRKERHTGWPLKVVVPEIEDIVSSSGWGAAEEALMAKLGEDYDRSQLTDEQIAKRNWYGRCVYEADNDVVDDQVVTISWDDDDDPQPARHGQHETGQSGGRGPKTAIFHMTYPTQSQCERRGRIYGSAGEITYDSHSITVYTFASEKTVTHVIPQSDPERTESHGGGDFGLAGAFVEAVQQVDSRQMGVEEAQRRYIGADLEEILRSHAVVFAAEEARLGKKVVGFEGWWEGKVKEYALGRGGGV